MFNDIKSRYYTGISDNLVMNIFIVHIEQKLERYLILKIPMHIFTRGR